MTESVTPKAKAFLDHFVKQGHTEARFKYLPHATLFKTLVERHHGIPAIIEKMLGNATTFDSKDSDILKEHFHVYGVKSTAHRVLGKFV